jgi:peptidase E
VNILAVGGGGWAKLIDHAFTLSGTARPRVCFIGTATGDDPAYQVSFYSRLSSRDCRPSHLSLFTMPNVADVADHLLAQNVIWVGGGSVANLLAVWRVHGVDQILREAWRRGVVLGGVSAGSLCWFEGGTTDSFGPELQPVTNGLGFLPHSNCPHYDSEERRRPTYHRLINATTIGPGYAAEDGVGLHFAGTGFVEAVTERPAANAYWVDRDGETAIPARPL